MMKQERTYTKEYKTYGEIGRDLMPKINQNAILIKDCGELDEISLEKFALNLIKNNQIDEDTKLEYLAFDGDSLTKISYFNQNKSDYSILTTIKLEKMGPQRNALSEIEEVLLKEGFKKRKSKN